MTILLAVDYTGVSTAIHCPLSGCKHLCYTLAQPAPPLHIAVVITRDARLIAIFPAGNIIGSEAQNNDCHLQHLFQVLINLHG